MTPECSRATPAGETVVSPPASLDQLALRRRPSGLPVMYQTWKKLLFLHWPMPPERLRPLIPEGLEIETWQGMAWVGVTPFTIDRIRPPLLPPVPLISSSHELNVRTYVRRDGVPGVWFLSLDASNVLAVWGARRTFFLPYYRAVMSLKDSGERIEFRSTRGEATAVPAEMEATWRLGARLPPAQPETKDFFLIERYCLYSERAGQLYQARIHHKPWPLCTASVEHLRSTMLESHGLSTPGSAPVVHAQAAPLTVAIWPPKRLSG